VNPSIEHIAKPVLSSMNSHVRLGVLHRVDAMERELAFLIERKNDDVAFIRSRGWSDERIQLLFVLNSLYQHLLGPVQAAARPGPQGLGRTIPIRHGKATFDDKTARRAERAVKDFLAIVETLQFQPRWLHANTCGDVVYAIATHEGKPR